MFDANCNLAAISSLIVSQYLIWRPRRRRLRAGEGCVRRVVGLVPSLLNCFLRLSRCNRDYGCAPRRSLPGTSSVVIPYAFKRFLLPWCCYLKKTRRAEAAGLYIECLPRKWTGIHFLEFGDA